MWSSEVVNRNMRADFMKMKGVGMKDEMGGVERTEINERVGRSRASNNLLAI